VEELTVLTKFFAVIGGDDDQRIVVDPEVPEPGKQGGKLVVEEAVPPLVIVEETIDLSRFDLAFLVVEGLEIRRRALAFLRTVAIRFFGEPLAIRGAANSRESKSRSFRVNPNGRRSIG
jgi:hypothetical protein